MKNRTRSMIAAASVVLLMATYFVYANKRQSETPVSHGSNKTSYISVVDGLRQQFGQSAVQPENADADPATQSLGKRSRIKVANEYVDVWEYSNATEANLKAKTISSDGSGIGNTQVEWASSSHWYKKGKVLALYIGNNKAVVNTLNGILGPQFAGSNFLPQQ